MNQMLTDIGYCQEGAQRGSIMSSSREAAKPRRDIEEIARIVVDTAFQSGMPMLSLTFGAVRLLDGPSMILNRKNMPGSYSLELKRNETSREPGSMRIMGIPCGERPLPLLWQTWVCSFRTPGLW